MSECTSQSLFICDEPIKKEKNKKQKKSTIYNIVMFLLFYYKPKDSKMKSNIILPSLFVFNAFLAGMIPKTSKAGSLTEVSNNDIDSTSYSLVINPDYLLPKRFGPEYVEIMPMLFQDYAKLVKQDEIKTLAYNISWHGGSWVKYTAEDGSGFIRNGGSRTWRNMNPGAIRPGKICNQYGACGSAGGFAVFPTEEHGMNALRALLKSDDYANLTIAAAIYKYAPPSDHNDTRSYQRKLSKMTGVSLNKKLNQLTPEEMERVVNTIKILEGWKPGKNEPFDAGTKISYVDQEMLKLMNVKSIRQRERSV